MAQTNPVSADAIGPRNGGRTGARWFRSPTRPPRTASGRRVGATPPRTPTARTPVGHGTGRRKREGTTAGQADHRQVVDAQLVEHDLEVGGEVEHGVTDVRRGQPDAGPVESQQPDTQLRGCEPSRLGDLPAGSRGAVEPHDGATTERPELGEAELPVPLHRDCPLDTRSRDQLQVELPAHGSPHAGCVGATSRRASRSTRERDPRRSAVSSNWTSSAHTWFGRRARNRRPGVSGGVARLRWRIRTAPGLGSGRDPVSPRTRRTRRCAGPTGRSAPGGGGTRRRRAARRRRVPS